MPGGKISRAPQNDSFEVSFVVWNEDYMKVAEGKVQTS